MGDVRHCGGDVGHCGVMWGDVCWGTSTKYQGSNCVSCLFVAANQTGDGGGLPATEVS